jgi:hypothetical protein
MMGNLDNRIAFEIASTIVSTSFGNKGSGKHSAIQKFFHINRPIKMEVTTK